MISLINEMKINAGKDDKFNWTQYQTLEQIYGWLDFKILQYPKILTNLTVGKSYENRTIRAVKLSKKSVNINHQRPSDYTR